jgi:hypothetical protein
MGFTVGVLFAFNSYQYTRLDFGNRPMLINSYNDCFFKNKGINCASCKEFDKLENEMINGKYPEGLK